MAGDAGILWPRPHDMRRAFATHMDEHGAPHPVIQRLLGHKLLSTTEQYIAARFQFPGTVEGGIPKGQAGATRRIRTRI